MISHYDIKMADLLIRNVPVKILAVLKARARRHHRSLQAEALDTLQQSAHPGGAGLVGWLADVRPTGAEERPGVNAIRQARDER